MLCVDPELIERPPGKTPVDWATRAIFSHPSCAKIWKQRASGARALESTANVMEMYKSIAREINDVDYVCSLGAGDGNVDKTIVKHITSSAITYFPVELSINMCQLAIYTMRDYYNKAVGIVGDFESGFEYVRNELINHRNGSGLLVCTGNTIGNLDLGERNFIENIKSIMNHRDKLLLSYATGTFPEAMDLQQFESQTGWIDKKGILACGIATQTGESIESAEMNLAHRLFVQRGESDVPAATAVELGDRNSGRVLLRFRRYKPKAFQRWIEDSFFLRILKRQEVHFQGFNVGLETLLLVSE